MVDTTDNNDEEELKRKKKRGEGESDGGTSSGTTFYRADAQGRITNVNLSVERRKQVWGDFRKLDLNESVVAIAEFFSEFPARASANLHVDWNSRGYAIVNMAIKFGQDVAMAVRERTRESSVQIRRRYGINIKMRQRGGVPSNVANPGANVR